MCSNPGAPTRWSHEASSRPGGTDRRSRYKKASPKRGLLVSPCWRELIIIPVVATDHDAAVVIAIVVVPALMPAAVMLVDACARAIIIAVAADIDADASRIGDGGGTDCKRCGCRKNISQPLHLFLLLLHRRNVNFCHDRLLLELARNFLEWLFRFHAVYREKAKNAC